jgi:hypothetical protein
MSNARARSSDLTSPAFFCARSGRRLPSELAELSPESCRSRRAKSGRYWGGADTGMCMGEGNVSELVALCLHNARPGQVSMASRQEALRGFLSKRVAERLLNKICENAEFSEARSDHNCTSCLQAPSSLYSYENQESASLEGSLPHLWC